MDLGGLAGLASMDGLPAAVALMLWVFYQLYWPSERSTKFQSIIDTITNKLDSVEERIRRTEKKMESHIQVTRAFARIEGKIDEKQVDEYLVENGVEPDDFIVTIEADGGIRPEESDGESDEPESPPQ